MNAIWPYMGDLRNVLPGYWADILVVLCSILCGMAVGMEREAKDKPAGLKTVTLICVGSTIFTLASRMISGPAGGDPGRIAAQVVTGIGFLGAGAIMRDRGTIIGLTTGATIWTVAAIGVLIGAGYAAAGAALTTVVLGMLTGVRHLEHLFRGACRQTTARIIFQSHNGKTCLRILKVLDDYDIPDNTWKTYSSGELEVMDIRYCHSHRDHRAFLLQLSEIPEVVEIKTDRLASPKPGI